MFEKSPGYVSQTNISANKQSKRTLKQSLYKTHKQRKSRQYLLVSLK